MTPETLSWQERYALLRDVGNLILDDPPHEELLRGIADRVIGASAADGAVLVRTTPSGKLDVVTARNYLKSDIAKPEFEVSRSLIDRAVKERKPVFVENALDLPEASRTRSLRELRVLSVIALPLQDSAEQPPFAVLYLDRRRPGRLFSRTDLEMLADVFAWANRTLELAFLARQGRRDPKLPSPEDRGGIVGSSPQIAEVFAFVERAAQTDANVLIRGETGTGKELVAQLLHQRSQSAAGPFVAINCAAIPSELLESELFGHEAGSFTGATGKRVGRMQEAAGGSLMLDEIGDMPLGLQAKILRVVESRKFTVVGGKDLPLKARIIAATHQPSRSSSSRAPSARTSTTASPCSRSRSRRSGSGAGHPPADRVARAAEPVPAARPRR
ncbi:MAG: sigma 54-interacting transcriptional regulator [Acidobacteriota bacterium]